MPQAPKPFSALAAADWSVSVLATVTQIQQPRQRRSLILINDSDTVIYIGYTPSITANNGIRLNAAGGALVIEPDNLGFVWQGEVWAIAAAAGGKNLCCHEEY